MKKEKKILACIAILAIIGGALAFRASRMPPNVYTLLPGSKVFRITLPSNIICTTTIPNCTLTNLATTAFGPLVIVSSTTTSPLSTTVFLCPEQTVVTNTFPYCTQWITRVTASND
jgi:hypothetical protein